MYEGPEYKAENGKIYSWHEGEDYYDVDWGMTSRGRGWFYLCQDTPENRKKYNIKLDSDTTSADIKLRTCDKIEMEKLYGEEY